MSQKVLITGATGFVGSNLAHRLIEEGYEVHVLTRRSSDKWRLADMESTIHNHSADLLEAEKLENIVKDIQPDIVFHLATMGIYGGVHSPEKNVIENNLFGTINLINACNEIDYTCFVNTGSSSEYGPKSEPMKESDRCEPVNVYGISKCASTNYSTLIAKTKDKPIINLRLFSPYGPYDDSRRLIPYVISNALCGNKLQLADSCAVRDYVYIDDVLDIYMKSINLAGRYKGEIFNVGRGESISVKYVVKKVLEISLSKSAVEWNTFYGRDHDCSKWEADTKKTSQYFKWEPEYSMEDGIRKTIQWFKSNPQLMNKHY
ncbi:NAD-dependent epimerase/dehydratase family protein [uncultured Methanolobus sp.]|uniref:NAD-dependent epimerase/dehydratase family protein n=1 Tax=uncultured Methanolobus sp. TaxID=218300 RepID=UPI002AAC2798|nr:NAD-dependent epimerase/dehydratase family protein [uncultured Methanolobus sp.]